MSPSSLSIHSQSSWLSLRVALGGNWQPQWWAWGLKQDGRRTVQPWSLGSPESEQLMWLGQNSLGKVPTMKPCEDSEQLRTAGELWRIWRTSPQRQPPLVLPWLNEGWPFLNGVKTTHKVFQRFSDSWTHFPEWSLLLKPSLNPNVMGGPTTINQSTVLNTLNVFAGPETEMWVLLITAIKVRKGSCSLNLLSYSQIGKIQSWGCFTWSSIFFGFFLFQLHPG